MSTITATGVTVPVGSDPYALTADLKKAFESARVIIPVQNVAQRNALPGLFPDAILPIPTVISRTDLGQQLQVWDGTGWRSGSGVDVYDVVAPDSNWNQVVRLSRSASADGAKKLITATILINRAAGGSFTIPNDVWWPVLSNLIPAGDRPPGSVPAGTVGYVDGPTQGTVQVRIDSTGSLQMKGVGGGVNIAANSSIYMTIAWVPA